MIVLRRLRVAALKQLRDIDIRFPQRGSVLIEGLNEAGKSTLFEAIYFALYGAALVGEDAHANLAALMPHGATDADTTLTFQIGDTELEVRRTLTTARRQAHDAALIVRRPDAPPERLHGPRAVNDRILQELGGLDGEALRNSCLMEQQALDRIESLSRTDREEAIANLLGLKRLIAIEAELKVTTEERAQVTRLRERLRLAREAAARRLAANAAQTAADALAGDVRVAELVALIADRDAESVRTREGAAQAARLTDEIARLDATIARAERIGAIARQLDDAATCQRDATTALEALAQTDERLATLARIANDELPLAERRLSDLHAQEAAYTDALRARDAALDDLRAVQADVRQEQALRAERQQRAQTVARLAEAAVNADAQRNQALATLAEAEAAATTARQSAMQAQRAADTHATARDALGRWVNAQAATEARASAAAAAEAGARTASADAERLAQRRDAAAAQRADNQTRARWARRPALVAGLAAVVTLFVLGGATAIHNGIAIGAASVVLLATLAALAPLAMRWRAAVASERTTNADLQSAERAAYEATARRDALLLALRDSALRDSALRESTLYADDSRQTNAQDGAAHAEPAMASSTAALPAPDATLDDTLHTVGIAAAPTTLASGRALLATLDAQAAVQRQAAQAAQDAARAADLQLAHARASAEAAQRQHDAAQQVAREAGAGESGAAPQSAVGAGFTQFDRPGATLAEGANAADESGADSGQLAERLAEAERAYAAASAALHTFAATNGRDTTQAAPTPFDMDAPGADMSDADAHHPATFAAQRGAAQATVRRLQAELQERAVVARRRAEQATRAQAALAALRAALTTAQAAADALAIPRDPQRQAGDEADGADTSDASGGSDSHVAHVPGADPGATLATLSAWRARVAALVATALAAYDVAALHARLGASRAEHDALVGQLAAADKAQRTSIERIRTALAQEGVACAGDESLADLAARWPALGAATSQGTSRPLAVAQWPASGDVAARGQAPTDLRDRYEQARRRADEARGAAAQALALLRADTGVAASAAGMSGGMDDRAGGNSRDEPTPDGAPDDAVDEDAYQTRLAEAERALRRRELAAQMARDVRARIARRVLPETEAYMRALLPELTAGRYRDVELLREDGAGAGGRGAGGADLRIRVWDQLAGRYVAKGLFSGGARDQVSLALRLAFALATLPKELGAAPGFIFLDEPLSAFDAERSAALERLLTRGVIARQFPQVFLISHSQTLDPAHFDYRLRMAAGRIVETNLPGA